MVRQTRLVSWVKATGLGDGYSKLQTRQNKIANLPEQVFYKLDNQRYL